MSGSDYTHPVADIRKYRRDFCLTFYLLLSSIARFVGKMLATTLRLLKSSSETNRNPWINLGYMEEDILLGM